MVKCKHEYSEVVDVSGGVNKVFCVKCGIIGGEVKLKREIKQKRVKEITWKEWFKNATKINNSIWRKQ